MYLIQVNETSEKDSSVGASNQIEMIDVGSGPIDGSSEIMFEKITSKYQPSLYFTSETCRSKPGVTG